MKFRTQWNIFTKLIQNLRNCLLCTLAQLRQCCQHVNPTPGLTRKSLSLRSLSLKKRVAIINYTCTIHVLWTKSEYHNECLLFIEELRSSKVSISKLLNSYSLCMQVLSSPILFFNLLYSSLILSCLLSFSSGKLLSQ